MTIAAKKPEPVECRQELAEIVAITQPAAFLGIETHALGISSRLPGRDQLAVSAEAGQAGLRLIVSTVIRQG